MADAKDDPGSGIARDGVASDASTRDAGARDGAARSHAASVEASTGGRPADEGDELPGVDAMIGTFLREPSLWPVLAVILGSGGAFTAALLVLAAVDRNPFAAAALLLILGMTIDVVIRARRHPSHRNGARLLLLVWSAGFALAGLAVWTGIAFTS